MTQTLTSAVSERTRRDAYAKDSEDFLCACLIIDHPQLEAPIRVISDDHNHVDAAGNVWRAIGFTVQFPNAEEGKPAAPAEVKLPDYPLTDDNSRYVSDVVEEMVTPADITVFAVNATASIDVVEIGPFEYKTKQFVMTLAEVTATLAVSPDAAQESAAVAAFVPATFRALFEVMS